MKSDFKTSAISNAVTLAVVIGFVVAFSFVFGSDNAIVGVGVVVVALMLLEKDLTAQPVLNALALVIFMVALGAAAFLATVNPWVGLVIDFVVVFVVCFLLVSDLERPFYFPFLLTYFFMVYVSPISIQNVDKLPMRLLSLLVGALAAIALQLAFNRTRISTIVQERLAGIASDLADAARTRAAGQPAEVSRTVDESVSALSAAIWERRTVGFRLSLGAREVTELASSMNRVAELLESLSDADFEQLGGGEFLGHLAAAFDSFPAKGQWQETAAEFAERTRAVAREPELATTLPIDAALLLGALETTSMYASALADTKDAGRRGADREPRRGAAPQGFGFADLLRAELKPGTLRFTFATRMAIVLSVVPLGMTLAMPYLPQLEHGRWAVFTLISVVQPISDATARRATQRVVGTVIGAIAFVLAFSLVTDGTLRAVLVLIASYINQFQPSYIRQMPFITFMALGSAAGSQPLAVDSLSLYRVLLIAAAAVLGVAASRYLFPYHLVDASRQLARRHLQVTASLLGQVAQAFSLDRTESDEGTFGTLVLAANLIQQQLVINAEEIQGQTLSRFVLAQRSAVGETTHMMIQAGAMEADERLRTLSSDLAHVAESMVDDSADPTQGESIRSAGAKLFASDATVKARLGGATASSIAQSLLDTPSLAQVGGEVTS